MALPINIKSLVSTNTVEWERKEFKENWNPEAIIRSVCAFANDINNWGGGYIIIGIAENNGKPVLPPIGLDIDELDKIQKKIVEVCNKLQATYFPVIEPYAIEGTHILVLWCPGGDNRPYSAPTTLGKKSQRAYYVRRGSATVKANTEEIRQLYELTAKIPFDDRINHHASINDLSLTLIREYLYEIKSKLYDELSNLNIEEVGLNMQIIKGSKEYLKPTNIGLLMFCENPQKYFRGAYIDITIYKDDHGTEYEQKLFKGAIHNQLRAALKFLKDNVIKETVKKIKGQAEAERFYNYPYLAIEETLVNAVYHRGYDYENQIEVNVRLDKIEIISNPGALPPIDSKALKRKTIVAKNYRNRRVGDFLKELKLTESKGTGLPKIYREMENNGSPTPVFEMDDERTYFLTILKIHQDSVKIREEIELLKYCKIPRTRKEILEAKLKLSLHTTNYKRHIAPLIESGYLGFTMPNKPTSLNQKYKTTEKGFKHIEENR